MGKLILLFFFSAEARCGKIIIQGSIFQNFLALIHFDGSVRSQVDIFESAVEDKDFLI